MLPDWLATAMRPAGGYGATIWAHSADGVDTTPWPLGPARSRPSARAAATSSASARRPSAPVSPYPAVMTNAARTPRAAQPRSTSTLPSTGVHTNTRSAAPSGTSSTDPSAGTLSRASPRSAASRSVANTRPAYPWLRMLWSTTNPNLPGCDDVPATITPRGSNNASKARRSGGAATTAVTSPPRRARRPRPDVRLRSRAGSRRPRPRRAPRTRARRARAARRRARPGRPRARRELQ